MNVHVYKMQEIFWQNDMIDGNATPTYFYVR